MKERRIVVFLPSAAILALVMLLILGSSARAPEPTQTWGDPSQGYVRVFAVDVDGSIGGNQTYLVASPGEEVTAKAFFQVWDNGNPNAIWVVVIFYEWALPPSPDGVWDAIYFAVPGSQPGEFVNASWSFRAPQTPGDYRLWALPDPQYSPRQTVENATSEKVERSGMVVAQLIVRGNYAGWIAAGTAVGAVGSLAAYHFSSDETKFRFWLVLQFRRREKCPNPRCGKRARPRIVRQDGIRKEVCRECGQDLTALPPPMVELVRVLVSNEPLLRPRGSDGIKTRLGNGEETLWRSLSTLVRERAVQSIRLGRYSRYYAPSMAVTPESCRHILGRDGAILQALLVAGSIATEGDLMETVRRTPPFAHLHVAGVKKEVRRSVDRLRRSGFIIQSSDGSMSPVPELPPSRESLQGEGTPSPRE